MSSRVLYHAGAGEPGWCLRLDVCVQAGVCVLQLLQDPCKSGVLLIIGVDTSVSVSLGMLTC